MQDIIVQTFCLDKRLKQYLHLQSFFVKLSLTTTVAILALAALSDATQKYIFY
jgi:hypothetical protein